MKNSQVKRLLDQTGWMANKGAWVLVDGQFGSTGKGLMAGALAEMYGERIDFVTSNAGPNSGHTSYYRDEKIVLQQLPTFSVVGNKARTFKGITHLNAGAVIDPARLEQEMDEHDMPPFSVFVHPNAAIVTDSVRAKDMALRERIGSTGKGTGAAIARKVMRYPDAVAGAHEDLFEAPLVAGSNHLWDYDDRIFVEVSQGFSLGVNDARFYPYTTSRECTAMQAMADARIPPTFFAGCMAVFRTFPIRVGGNSGPGYPDQAEIQWSDIGVEPEITTVTQKQRRIFTWSRTQFFEAISANRPEYLFINFMQYLQGVDHEDWIEKNVMRPYGDVMGHPPRAVLTGWGPYAENIRTEF